MTDKVLTLIEGGHLAATHEKIMERVVCATNGGERCFLIVPEQNTLGAERECLKLLPESSALIFEATNFTRFADSVFRVVGGVGAEYATGVQKSILMWRALTETAPFTDDSAPVSAGAVKRALDAEAQMAKLSITPSDLDSAHRIISESNSPASRRLCKKLSQLSSTISVYHTLLRENMCNSEDILEALAAKIPLFAKSIPTPIKIFIDGFTSFTAPQSKLIEALMRHFELTVTLKIPKEGRCGAEFAETTAAHEGLIRSASRVGADVKLIQLPSYNSESDPLINDLLMGLWRTGHKLTEEGATSEAVRIFEAATPYEECDFVASDIKRRVMGGDKYSDFAVIARTPSSYDGILDSAFEKAGIPIFIPKNKDVSSFELIKLIYSAYAAVVGGYSMHDVITYSKCSLCGVDADHRDELELYCHTWQISGRKFTDGGDWEMNPHGFGGRFDDKCTEALKRINEARRGIIAPLSHILNTREDVDVTLHAKSLWSFLETLDVEKQLAQRADRWKRCGRVDDANDTDRLWKITVKALDELVSGAAGIKVSTEAFLTLLKIAFDGVTVGRLPSFVDSVSAGGADTARMTDKKHVYLLGANYGVFPKNTSDIGYFSEKDKESLQKAGLPISPDRDISISKELYYFSRAISFGKNTVTLLYHTKDSAYNPASPSEAIKRIISASDKKILPIIIKDLPDSDKLWSVGQALERLGNHGDTKEGAEYLLRVLGYSETVDMAEKDVRNTDLCISEDIAASLYGGELSLTQSRIDKFVGCPLSYYLGYTLKISENKKAEFDAANIGTFIHLLLEKLFAHAKDSGIHPSKLTASDRQTLIRHTAEEFVAEAFRGVERKSAREEHSVERLCRAAVPIMEGLMREYEDCQYIPTFFELPIEKNKKGSPTPVVYNTENGEKISVFGVIDRVDTFKKDGKVYVRVIDYKTGNKVFSPKDLERGENLQMFLYLKAISECSDPEFLRRIGADSGETLVPAGVIYVKADVTEGKISSPDITAALDAALEKQTRQGMVLADENALGGMNCRYLPIKYNEKQGALELDSKFAYTEEGWRQINDILERSVTGVAKRILGGEATALPLKNGKSSPCEYCDFKAVCRRTV